MRIGVDSKICIMTELAENEAVYRAVGNLARDLRKACAESKTADTEEKEGAEEKTDTEEKAGIAKTAGTEETADTEETQGLAEIRLVSSDCGPEEYRIHGTEGRLEIGASDSLGFVYGIYAVSREILRIHNFWFWNDQRIRRQEFYEVPDDIQICSMPYAVRYRGWFINDEVLLHTWKVDQKEDKPWEMAFEALLRCGGNLVIPGTGRNADKYGPLAAAMGLYLTHHHSQPLGAEMFVQAYPHLNPSYEEHADKFKKLWQEGIEKQKGCRVVWSIGFRGQGDYPFWVNDPRYQTPESQGELMGSILRQQYDLVKQAYPDAVCCTNLYGETMELYQKGCLKLPDDVIRIWADNGFGKMVTRRQENHNPRIPALPSKEEQENRGRHGIYYHVSFYDLQAANHMTMLPNQPEFINRELQKVRGLDVTEYWLINCSNVKPHVYYLDMISKIWQQGDVDVESHRREYVSAYYGSKNAELIADCLKDYFHSAVSYGPNEDDHAGEQFSNHVARMLISQYMKDKNSRADDLLWASDADTLKGQTQWYLDVCRKAEEGYRKYLRRCEQADAELGKDELEAEPCGENAESGRRAALAGEGQNPSQMLFRDSLLLQAKIHYHCFKGACLVCESILESMRENYQRAFYYAGCARKEYLAADHAMRDREHGKWKGFYANECLTDIKQTAWVLEGLMSYIRNLGDGPHYYQWQRDFLYAEEDRRVMLIMNMENHLRDLELFELMEQKWGD